MDRDKEGHREYHVVHYVETTTVSDGPQVVMLTAGLPIIGAVWNFGNDVDNWAMCHPDMSIRKHRDARDPDVTMWEVDQLFSTKPLYRCQTTEIGNPLLEPQEIGGGTVRYNDIPKYDENGDPIENSAHEPLSVPFDENRPTVYVSQNVASLGEDVWGPMVDTVNDEPLWGFGPRQVKLSDVRWQRKLYGVCNYYYTRRFGFDTNADGFDKVVPDEGTKVLHGEWSEETGEFETVLIAGLPPDPDNIQHFDRFKDRNGEIMHIQLDGEGMPATTTGPGTHMGGTGPGQAASIVVRGYAESNFLLLGIPATL